MPSKEREDSRIVSVRLPNTLVQRLDRLLDWQMTHRRRPATRNAALRDALHGWLDQQEQLAGLLDPRACGRSSRLPTTACGHLLMGPIYRLRRLLQWPGSGSMPSWRPCVPRRPLTWMP